MVGSRLRRGRLCVRAWLFSDGPTVGNDVLADHAACIAKSPPALRKLDPTADQTVSPPWRHLGPPRPRRLRPGPTRGQPVIPRRSGVSWRSGGESVGDFGVLAAQELRTGVHFRSAIERLRSSLSRIIWVKSSVGRISKDPPRTPGCFDINWMAWFKSVASSIKIPPNCSLVSA